MPTPLKLPIPSGQRQIDTFMQPRSREPDETNATGNTLLDLQNLQKQPNVTKPQTTSPILTRRRRIQDDDDDIGTVTTKPSTQSTAVVPILIQDDDDSDPNFAVILKDTQLPSPACAPIASPVITTSKPHPKRTRAKRSATRSHGNKPGKPLHTVSDDCSIFFFFKPTSVTFF
jgi:hypothetical protein